MRRLTITTAAALTAGGAAAALGGAPAAVATTPLPPQPVASITAAGASVEKITKVGPVDFRFTAQGGSTRDLAFQFSVRSTSVAASAYGDAVETVAVRRLDVDGGTLQVLSRAAADMVPTCRRGGDVSTESTQYRLDVPKDKVATITVRTTSFPGLGKPGKVGVNLNWSRYSTGPDDPVTTEAPAPLQTTVPSSAYLDGVSLRAAPVSGGRTKLSGRVKPARRGVKVTFVTRTPEPLTDEGVNLAFGAPESVLRPKRGLRVIGSVVTDAKGRFTATRAIPGGTAVAARTAGKRAGASCGVLVPLRAVAGS